MRLKILLPYGVFAERTGVTRIVAETREGSCGFLPRRRDCVVALVPGILVYQCEGQSEVYAAVDEGLLVKTGPEVFVSVRNAVAGDNLGQLHAAVENDFRRLDADEQRLRAELHRIESGLISRVVALHRD